jgi:hypothetical protein
VGVEKRMPMNEQKIQRPSSLETRLRGVIMEEILEENRCFMSIRFEVVLVVTFLLLGVLLYISIWI